MSHPNKHTNNNAIYHPRRTLEESRKLCDGGWYPFPELTIEENDEIFVARLAGFASCFPAHPTALDQAMRTLRYARDFTKSA
jgi:hypothetical protein